METAAAAAFKKGDFASVTRFAGPGLTSGDSLLVGLAHLQLGDVPEAMSWLDAIAAGGGNFAPDAEYYGALAQLKGRHYDAALTRLKAIRANGTHLYHAQVSPGLIRKVQLLKWKE